jgi:hypothetical protein
MVYLIEEKQATEYYFLVHMDETKKLADGSPDPVYVREYRWGINPPPGQTEAEYLANIKNEISLLVADELSHMN